MAFTRFNKDTQNISALSDRPNQNDGLSAAQLKGLHDKAPTDLKYHLNDVLMEELERTTDGDSGADNIGATAVGNGIATTVQGVLEELDADVTALDGTAVHKTGNETIEDTKTFTDSPIVPMPTAGEHAVCRDYIESITSTSLSETTPGKLLDATMGKEIWDGLISRTASATEDRNAIWSDLNEHRGETDNPHEVTAEQVGALSITDAGDLTELTTTEKGSLVGAINELNTDKVETSAIVNTLTETEEGKVLDARQGKVLADLVSTKVDITDIVNDLTTGGADKALSAEQGVELAQQISQLDADKADKLKVALIENELNTCKSTLANVNINNEATQDATGYGVVSLPKNAANGHMGVKVEGVTATNLVTNGNFADGTTGWISSYSSSIASNNTLQNTANGTGTGPYVRKSYIIPYVENKKIYCRAKARVMNSDASSLTIRMYCNPDTITVKTQSSPVKDTWYDLSSIVTLPIGGSASILEIAHNYADGPTANGKVMEVQEVIAIDLTALGLDSLTVDQCNQRFPYWFDGTKSVQTPLRVRSVSADETHESSLYLPDVGVLRSVPNGTKDEINVTTGVKTQRVSDWTTSKNNVIISGISGESWQIVGMTSAYFPASYLDRGLDEGVGAGVVNVYSPQYTNGGWEHKDANGQEAICVNGTSKVIYLRVLDSKTGILDADDNATKVSKFQLWLRANPITLIYQLATPVVTPIQSSGTLVSFPSGTVYVEKAIADAGIYDSGITVLNTDKPISTLESLSKIDFATGQLTPLDASTAVIAGDGLSFTHPDLTDDDIVFFTYFYDAESTEGEASMTYYDSRYVIEDSVNSKFYKWAITSANGVPSIGLVEV